ncbi:MAG: nucleoside hydrolase [Rubrivivax sp.]|nr:nucleoside hydrolase [Rubrivivax sp.]
MPPPKKVLLDTDPGVDDAMALAFLHRHAAVNLLGITTVFGNAEVEVTTRNALYLAERFGIGAPVARGAALPLVRPLRGAAAQVHGDDGLGNLQDPIAPARPLDPRPAHRLIIDTVRAHPGEVTLVAVGPLTNLALALSEEPALTQIVREVVVMGGAFGTHGHGGNVSPVAEANVMCDPHAADAVFTAPWPVTIVGLDVTHEVLMDSAAFERLRAEGGEEGAFLFEASRHYVDFYRRAVGVAGCFMHDASAAACVLVPELFTTRRGPLRVVCEGIALGQTIQSAGGRRWSHGEAWAGLPAQQVCTAVQADAVLELFLRTLRRPRGGQA